MSMQAASLEVLERANLPSPQARAIVQAIEIEIAAGQNTLIAREAFAEFRQETKQEFAQVRQEMSEMRHGLELKIEGLDKKIDGLHGEFGKTTAELRGEFGKGIADVRTEVHATARDTVWRMLAAIGVQTTLLLGLGYFALAHLKP